MLETIFNLYVMVFVWLAVICTSVAFAYKTRLYPIYLIAAGSAPVLILYTYRVLDLWEEFGAHGIYIVLCLLLIYRDIRYEL